MNDFDILKGDVPLLKLSMNTDSIKDILTFLHSETDRNTRDIGFLSGKITEILKYQRLKDLEKEVHSLKNETENKISKFDEEFSDFLLKFDEKADTLQKQIDKNNVQLHQELNNRLSKFEKTYEPLLLVTTRIQNLSERLDKFLSSGDELSKLQCIININNRIDDLEKLIKSMNNRMNDRENEINERFEAFSIKMSNITDEINSKQESITQEINAIKEKIAEEDQSKENNDSGKGKNGKGSSKKSPRSRQAGGSDKNKQPGSARSKKGKNGEEQDVIRTRDLDENNIDFDTAENLRVIVSGRKRQLNPGDLHVETGNKPEEEYEEETNDYEEDADDLQDIKLQVNTHEIKLQNIDMIIKNIKEQTNDCVTKLRKELEEVKEDNSRLYNEAAEAMSARLNRAEQEINIVTKHIREEEDETAIGQQSCRCMVCGRKTNTARSSSSAELAYLQELCTPHGPTSPSGPGAKVTLMIGEKSASTSRTSRPTSVNSSRSTSRVIKRKTTQVPASAKTIPPKLNFSSLQ